MAMWAPRKRSFWLTRSTPSPSIPRPERATSSRKSSGAPCWRRSPAWRGAWPLPEPAGPCDGAFLNAHRPGRRRLLPAARGRAEHVHNLALQLNAWGHPTTVVTSHMGGDERRDAEFVRRVGTSRVIYANGGVSRV